MTKWTVVVLCERFIWRR